jgi:hypothetical protein
MKEEHGLKMFERRIFGHKRGKVTGTWRELYIYGFLNF